MKGSIVTEIVLYTRKFCGYCIAAKRLLDEKGVVYEERDATFSSQLRQEMTERAAGQATFPQIFVGDVHVGGCSELYDLEQSGKLDALISA